MLDCAPGAAGNPPQYRIAALAARRSEPVTAVQMLALTGRRPSQVLDLSWCDIGSDTIDLPDSKTNPRAVPLGKAARAHIDALPIANHPGAFQFPAFADGKGNFPLQEYCRVVCSDTRLGNLRLHDFRHAAASQTVIASTNLTMNGKVLRHQRHRTTTG